MHTCRKAVLAEIFEQCQAAGKFRTGVSVVKKKHQRHGDELSKLEEVCVCWCGCAGCVLVACRT